MKAVMQNVQINYARSGKCCFKNHIVFLKKASGVFQDIEHSS